MSPSEKAVAIICLFTKPYPFSPGQQFSGGLTITSRQQYHFKPSIKSIIMSTATMVKPSKVVNYETDPHIESHVKAFLKLLNSDDGPPMEEMDPYDAKKVLENAQASV